MWKQLWTRFCLRINACSKVAMFILREINNSGGTHIIPESTFAGSGHGLPRYDLNGPVVTVNLAKSGLFCQRNKPGSPVMADPSRFLVRQQHTGYPFWSLSIILLASVIDAYRNVHKSIADNSERLLPVWLRTFTFFTLFKSSAQKQPWRVVERTPS